MRPSQKSNRSRGKSNRSNKSLGNVINRVFESAGPEGKVRGTPQQIIDKYEQLARDAQTSGDRVTAENFLQHAEHYARILSSAQAEMQAKRDEQQQQQPPQQQQPQQQQHQGRKDGGEQPQHEGREGQPGGGDSGQGGGLETFDTREEGSPLVTTPETTGEEGQGQQQPQQGKKPARRRRSRRSDKGGGEGGASDGSDGGETRQSGSTEPVSG
ncbi:MAG: DUF4167 domain-containing protein [Pseudomonadota bacterium]